MRCPKCGYITFDHLETCTKCRKNIADVSLQLTGTVYKAEVPSFLQFEVQELEPDTDTSAELLPEGEGIELDILAEEADGGNELELSVEEGISVADEPLADEDLDLDFMDESVEALGLDSSVDDEFDLDFPNDETHGLDLDEGAEDAGDEDGPQLDFSDLDISDLAPPAADEDDMSSTELTLDGIAGTSTAADGAARSSMAQSGAGLEDLQMDGLDLEMPSLPPVGSVTERKLRTSVKTGTALDDFDIDLGELISAQEK